MSSGEPEITGGGSTIVACDMGLQISKLGIWISDFIGHQSFIISISSTERQGPEMLGHGAQHSRRQEQQRSHEQYCTQQHKSKRHVIGAHRPGRKGRHFLCGQAGG
jgi:hypothetical protein